MNTVPTKVTLTVTCRTYTVTVFAGKKVLSKRKMVRERPGFYRATEAGDIFDDLADWEKLAEAIDVELPGGPSICHELQEARDWL